jgi:FtsP/CotA-like multicopper oxidase with cupredoxin domain
MNTSGMIYTFSILSFVLMMMFTFAPHSSTFNSVWDELFNPQTEALAQPLLRSQPSSLDGMNFSKPQDVYSKDGVLKTAISVDYLMGKLDNKSIISMAYNGSIPGPALHVYPGDRVEIDLINNLNESTNLHFHGLHVSPGNNSDGSAADNIFLDVAPGKTQHYTLDIPKDHPPGSLWYHSHFHQLSYGQVSAGLSGMFIVEGLEKLLPESLQNITTRTFAMRDIPFDQAYITTEHSQHSMSNTNTGTERNTVNGEINPFINITSGETQLWRLANIGSENELGVQLPGHTFHVIAEDGSPVWEVWENDTLFLPSGKRFDVLVTATGNGSIPLNNTFAEPYGTLDHNIIATVNILGNQKDVEHVNIIPTSLTPKEDLNNANITNHRVLNFSSNDVDWIYKINNETFDHHRIDQTVKLGTVEEWKLINLDGVNTTNIHPFHIHVNDFQVISVNGKPYDARGLQDTVIIPTGGEVVIRIPFKDFVGKTVYHCHLMFHGDGGMMGVVEMVK